MSLTTLGAVVGLSNIQQAVLTTSNGTQYTSGDNIGGLYTLSNLTREATTTAMLQSLTIWDKDNQKSKLQIDFWSEEPVNGTYNNNVEQVMAPDFDYWLGNVIINTTDYESSDSASLLATATKNYIGLLLKSDGTYRDVFMTVKSLGTPTFTSTSGLMFNLGFFLD